MKFNERLLEIRKKQGLSQEELGQNYRYLARQFLNGKQVSHIPTSNDW